MFKQVTLNEYFVHTSIRSKVINITTNHKLKNVMMDITNHVDFALGFL